MIAFFVAREGDQTEAGKVGEFARYKRAVQPPLIKLVKSPSGTEENSTDASDDDEPMSADDISEGNDKGREYDYPVQYFCVQPNKTNDAAVTIIAEMTKHKDAIKTILDKIIASKTSQENAEVATKDVQDVSGFLKKFHEIAHEKDERIQDSEVKLFIHWGGGNPFAYEQTFADLVQKTEYKEIDAFALSTRRSECFDVCGAEIFVPVGEEALRMCLSHFMVHQIKDLMMAYVCKTKIKKFDDHEKNVFIRYLDELICSGINRTHSEDNAKWMLKTAKLLRAEVINNGTIKEDEGFVALMATLLREGVCHG